MKFPRKFPRPDGAGSPPTENDDSGGDEFAGVDEDLEFAGVDEDTEVQIGPAVLPVEELMTGAKAKSVQFPVSRPHGYSYKHVEAYVDHVAHEFRKWADACHSRDLRIHALDRELGLQIHDNQRLRVELELFRVQGDALVNTDGSLVTESQLVDSPIDTVDAVEVDALRRQVTELTAALQDMTTQRDTWVTQAQQAAAAAPPQPQTDPVTADRLREAETQLAQQGGELVKAQQELRDARQTLTAGRQYAATLEQEAERLRQQVNDAQQRLDQVQRERDDAARQVANLTQWVPPVDELVEVATSANAIATKGSITYERRDPLLVWQAALHPEMEAATGAESLLPQEVGVTNDSMAAPRAHPTFRIPSREV